MNNEELKPIVEGLIFAAEDPMSIKELFTVFTDHKSTEQASTNHKSTEQASIEQVQIKEVLDQLKDDYEGRGLELKEVGSGFRFQVRETHASWISKLWQERPARYSRASLETLALIAYRQPITRAEIEDVRGVSVSSNIVKALLEREWVRVVGHRDVPGKPALYSTTKEFLNYFNLKSLEELPALSELKDIDAINEQLNLSQGLEQTDSNTETSTDEASAAEMPTAENDDSNMDEMETVDDLDVSEIAATVNTDAVNIDDRNDDASNDDGSNIAEDQDQNSTEVDETDDEPNSIESNILIAEN